MKLRRFWLLAFSALLLIPLLPGDAFSEENNYLAASTDKSTYAAGETITVTGHVSLPSESYPAILQVLSPNGNFVHVAQITLDSEDSFTEDVITDIGGKWKQTGTYIIKISHYFGNAEMQIEYGGLMSAQLNTDTSVESEDDSTGGLELAFSGLGEFSGDVNVIELDGYNIFYKINNGKVLKIIPDTESMSLIIQLETFNDGDLLISLPKQVIDTVEVDFFVLADGEETVYYSEQGNDAWVLMIPFYNGTEEIEIIGTFVIPEFGTIAAIILAVAITSIIVLSAKTKLSIMPKL